MKIGKLEISISKQGTLSFKMGFQRLLILFTFLPLSSWGFTSGLFEAQVQEDNGQMVEQMASFIHLGPMFIMYTRPNG